MTHPEAKNWEQLCLQCGRCCLRKFQKDGKTVYTRVACFMLSVKTRKCKNYLDRQKYVADCKQMTPNLVPDWLPSTCSYVRCAAGLPLATMEEVDQLYPWDNVISERELITFKVEDYELE